MLWEEAREITEFDRDVRQGPARLAITEQGTQKQTPKVEAELERGSYNWH
jgi:hypothetical protein